jgi:hypothetical protein
MKPSKAQTPPTVPPAAEAHRISYIEERDKLKTIQGARKKAAEYATKYKAPYDIHYNKRDNYYVVSESDRPDLYYGGVVETISPPRPGTKYPGRSWNAWNVSLWIQNDEPLYRLALECLANPPVERNNRARWFAAATRQFISQVGKNKTPDGAVYNRLSVLECLKSLAE